MKRNNKPTVKENSEELRNVLENVKKIKEQIYNIEEKITKTEKTQSDSANSVRIIKIIDF